MPNITTNHAITYTNTNLSGRSFMSGPRKGRKHHRTQTCWNSNPSKLGRSFFEGHGNHSSTSIPYFRGGQIHFSEGGHVKVHTESIAKQVNLLSSSSHFHFTRPWLHSKTHSQANSIYDLTFWSDVRRRQLICSAIQMRLDSPISSLLNAMIPLVNEKLFQFLQISHRLKRRQSQFVRR